MQTAQISGQAARRLATPATAPRRNYCLDGIRGIAVALVIVHHTLPGIRASSPTVTALLNYAAHSAWIGVDLFFVLSGFLITGILLRTRDSADYFRLFYMRRFFRIFPLYYFLLATMYLVVLIRFGMPENSGPWWNVLYLANLRMALYGHPWRPVSHLWSLSVEEQFYLIWPALIFFVSRRRTTAVLASLFIGFVVARQVICGVFRVPATAVYGLLHLDGLLIGAALASFARDTAPTRTLRTVAAFGVLLSGAVLSIEAARWRGLEWSEWSGLQLLNYAVIATFAASLIAVSLWSDSGAFVNRLLAARPLVAVGKYSYSIYLLHNLIDCSFRSWGLRRPGFVLPLAYLGAVALLSFFGARLTWKLIERPCEHMKERWFPYETRRKLAATAGYAGA